MDDLIGDLLTLARRGEHVSDVEVIALPDLIEPCWRSVETAEAELRVAADGTVRADRGRLRQLLENLFRSAIEHGGAGGPVVQNSSTTGIPTVAKSVIASSVAETSSRPIRSVMTAAGSSVPVATIRKISS